MQNKALLINSLEESQLLQIVLRDWIQKPHDKSDAARFSVACKLYGKVEDSLDVEEEEMDPTAGSFIDPFVEGVKEEDPNYYRPQEYISEYSPFKEIFSDLKNNLEKGQK